MIGQVKLGFIFLEVSSSPQPKRGNMEIRNNNKIIWNFILFVSFITFPPLSDTWLITELVSSKRKIKDKEKKRHWKIRHCFFRTDKSEMVNCGSASAAVWDGENIHNEALNFHPIFIPFFRCQVSGVSVQDMKLRLPFLTPETWHLKPNFRNKYGVIT